jgi:alanine dehydrogenase
MSKSLSPFTKQQLLPQEETLEIFKRKGELYIGIPKETAFQEKRVCLTPDAVSALINNGHKVLLEAGAGVGASFSDKDYSEAGAEISKDSAKVYGCPIILKVEPPSLEQIKLLNPQTILISALQLKTQSKKYFELLAAKRITALAFEFIRDNDGLFPAVRSLSEIAGTASTLIASELLSNSSNGNGLLFGNISGVPPIEVVIIGAGTVGEFAARSAIGLGANVKIFDNSISKLRRIQTNLGRPMFTSTFQPKNLMKALKRCDVAIGAVRGSNRAPVVVTEAMVEVDEKRRYCYRC